MPEIELAVQRAARSRNGSVVFKLDVSVLPQSSYPRSALYLKDVALEELAATWDILQSESGAVDERNAILAAKATDWSGATLKTLNQEGLQIMAPSPIVAAAVEERLRRALDLLFICDRMEELIFKGAIEAVQVPSDDFAPTGKPVAVSEPPPSVAGR